MSKFHVSGTATTQRDLVMPLGRNGASLPKADASRASCWSSARHETAFGGKPTVVAVALVVRSRANRALPHRQDVQKWTWTPPLFPVCYTRVSLVDWLLEHGMLWKNKYCG